MSFGAPSASIPLTLQLKKMKMTPEQMLEMSLAPNAREKAARAGVSPDELKATVLLVKAVADCIRELEEVPSGHLYARLQGTLSLNTYNRVLDFLKKAKLITVQNHLIKWVG